jgi:hypothetical protein
MSKDVKVGFANPYLPGERYEPGELVYFNGGLRVVLVTIPAGTTATGTEMASVLAEGEYVLTADLRTEVLNHVTSSWAVPASEVTPAGKYISQVSHSTACDCVLDTPLSLGAEPGDKVHVMQGGAGTLTITVTGSANYIGNPVFSAQYEIKTVIALNSTTWLLLGVQ